MNNEIKYVSPFKRLCVSIGNLPTAYIESMSYYECITFLVKFLDNEVIPTVNNNSEVVKELQDYVANYFDNLDVQEEINNKLDEMADSGELVQIINAYLGSATVNGYDTLPDLKASENLIDGVICRTLGTSTIDDGYGNYYKIRELLEGDVIDEDNLVALTNYPELVAQKIKDQYLIDLNTTVTSEIENINDKIENANFGIWGISQTVSLNDHKLVYSPDGINFYNVGSTISGLSDSSAVIEINGIFYYIGNNYYKYSTDLINWSSGITITESDREVWGSSFAYDDENDIIYCYQSYRYNDDTFTDSVGNTGRYFKIIVRAGTQNSDGTITFGSQINLTSEPNTYYDPYVIKDNKYGILMAMCNTQTNTISVYTMNTFTNLGDLQCTTPFNGLEAPQLITNGNGDIVMYTHVYAMGKSEVTNLNTSLPQTYCLIKITRGNRIANSDELRLIPTKEAYTFRHAGLNTCSKNVLNILQNIGIYPIVGLNNTSSTIGNGINQYIVRSDNVTYTGTYNLINHPNVLYTIRGLNGSSTVINVINAYSNEPLKLNLENASFEWGSTGTLVSGHVLTSNRAKEIIYLPFQEDSGKTFVVYDE